MNSSESPEPAATPTPGSDEPVVDRLFGDALELPVDERAAFLDQACDGDHSLRREVESLLEAHADADAVLGQPLTEGERDPMIGQTIGVYEITKRLGAGGMGVVYEGCRTGADFEQRVAIKLVRSGSIAPEDVIARFRLERRVLAQLEHPNIARLIDGGSTAGGQPYLVMDLVEGEPIDAYCDRTKMTVHERVALVRAVCGAVTHAHRNLVIHRDLKPANILVRDTPDGPEPKLLDFGIAKLIEEDAAPDVTVTAQRRLTPAYASPEQVRGEIVTTSSDVYALGVILYELLTGKTPYAGTDSLESAILTSTPTRPSAVITGDPAIAAERSTEPAQLRRALKGDLEHIVLMALRKEPDRRYASADQLADDLGAFLSGLPVRARPDSFGYRATRFVQRNAWGVSAAVVVAIALVIASVVSTISFVRAEAARVKAEAVSSFLTDMLGSIDPEYAKGRDTSVLAQMLAEASQRVDAELAEAPESAAELHLAIGQVYVSLGQYPEAETHLARAAELRLEQQDVLGAADVDLRLSELFQLLSRFEEAEPLIREVVRVRQNNLGARHPGVADALAQLGLLQENAGDIGDAEVTLRTAVEIQREGSSDDDPALARTLNLYGLYFDHRRRPEEAMPLLVEALEIARRGLGDDSVGLVNYLTTLALFHRRHGPREDALPLLDEALAICDAQLPEDHSRRLNTLSIYANALQSVDRHEEAEPMYREVLKQETAVFGRNHKEVGTTTNNLASLMRAMDRHDEAIELFDEAADIYRAVFGPDHYWVTIALYNRVLMQAKLGRCEAARPGIDEVLRIRRLNDAAPEQIADAEVALAICLVAEGQESEARAMFERILRVLIDRYGDKDKIVQDVQQRLERLNDTSGARNGYRQPSMLLHEDRKSPSSKLVCACRGVPTCVGERGQRRPDHHIACRMCGADPVAATDAMPRRRTLASEEVSLQLADPLRPADRTS